MWKYESMHGPYERMQKKIHLISFDLYLTYFPLISGQRPRCFPVTSRYLQDGKWLSLRFSKWRPGTSRTIKIRLHNQISVCSPHLHSPLGLMGTLRRLFSPTFFGLLEESERHHLGFLWRAFGKSTADPYPGTGTPLKFRSPWQNDNKTIWWQSTSSTTRKK